MTDVISADPLIGQSIGEYQFVRELGRGASGVVYLADHLATGLNVAIKVAHRPSVADAAVRRRLELEARFANQIALETVVNVFDFNHDPSLGPYVVMEYLQGETLYDVANSRLPAAVALRLLAQVADTLATAHEHHILHGGLKPSNIFLTLHDKKEGVAKLLPFGVAMGPPIEGEEPIDRAVARLGSADFRAPEQAMGAPPDPRMDIYALGAIAYLLATGRRPFTAPTNEALERAHAEVVPIAPHRVDTRVSRGWSAIILRALEKSPERRYQTARELAEAFRRAPVAGGPVASTMVLLDPSLGLEASGAMPAPSTATPAPISAGLSQTFEFTTPIPGQQSQTVVTPGGGTSAVRLAPGEAAPSSPCALSAPTPAQGLVLRVTVSAENGQSLGAFPSSSVTRAGLIVCTAGPLPVLLSRVRLSFADLGGMTCEAQVVHHVTPEQAAQWKLSPGYGVQFGTLSAEQRTLLESAHKGLRPQESLAERPDDPEATEVLKRYSAERAADAYAMLAISKAAPFDAIRDRVRDARRMLERLAERPLSTTQQKAFEQARARLDEVGKTLGEPMKRLEHDAQRGNFEGVARCISAGVSVVELEEVRGRFLKSHPGIAGKSLGNIQTGQSLEAAQQMARALEAYAEALRIDPLNLVAQQRYWSVRRQLEKS